MSDLQVEQEENDDDDGGDKIIGSQQDPSSGAASSSPAAANGPTEGGSAAQEATKKTPKQGLQAEEGAAGEGRVQGTGKRGGLTETEGRSTGHYDPPLVDRLEQNVRV